MKKLAALLSSSLNLAAAVQHSWTTGPFAGAITSTWSKWITPVTVGTAWVVVNGTSTYTSTSFSKEFLANGHPVLFTPTSTNSAGYRTFVSDGMTM